MDVMRAKAKKFKTLEFQLSEIVLAVTSNVFI